MSWCTKCFDGETNCMYFLIKFNELLEKHHEIWAKVSNNNNKEFDKGYGWWIVGKIQWNLGIKSAIVLIANLKVN